METQIANAIHEMLASGFSVGDIKEGFETVDIDSLVDEVEEEYRELTNEE